MNDTSPLSIILVQNGTKGDKLLFYYPFEREVPETKPAEEHKSPYAMQHKDDMNPINPAAAPVSSIDNNHLIGFSDKLLSNLFAVKTKLCGRKLELKVNDVRFVGHPMEVQALASFPQKYNVSSILTFNIIFALRAYASPSVVNCYHDFSRRLSAALRHEERRCFYLTKQAKIMLANHDEASDEERTAKSFAEILPQSTLAQELKSVYESLCNSGDVSILMNNWVKVSFNLPQRVYSLVFKNIVIEPENLRTCFNALRPYHGLLFLVDDIDLRSSLNVDGCSPLERIIQNASPTKSFQELANDADLPISHVFDLISHLVYWGKATIIYPVCETNVYVLSPHAPTNTTSQMVDKFAEKFPGYNLLSFMSDFSFPTSLHPNPIMGQEKQHLRVKMVIWMLQHRILLQLHTYIYLMPTPDGPSNLSEKASDDSPQVLGNDLYVPSQLQNIYDYVYETTGKNFFHKEPTPDRLTATNNCEALPSYLTLSEKDNILKVPAASNLEDLILFGRLCPYFRGKHHIEEIMYLENLRRSQILILLDKFRQVLSTCQHADTAVAMFYRS
ncbi:hypothetical protein CHUAL_001607 [Chamberlinius hualienensis]